LIPRLIHRIWFGSNPMPSEYEDWWKGWQRQLPHYEFVTWTDRDIHKLKSAELIRQAKSMAQRADIARYEIMSEFGGTYLDCDFMPLNYYDFSAQDSDLVICHESEVPEVNCSNGFYSIRKGHPLMRVAMELVQHAEGRSTEVIGQTGPGFFGRLVRSVQHKRLPAKSFYPYYFNEPFSNIYSRDLSESYGAHVWMNSWFNDDLRLRKINSMLVNGSLSELDRLWNGMSPQLQEQATNFPQMIARMRDSRRAMMDMVIGTPLLSLVKAKPMLEFELFKACMSLFGQFPNAMVWQIGCGDGIACDSLRPALINFDPPAMLIDANPMLCEEAKANYANNKNLQVINLAVGASIDDGSDAGKGMTYLYTMEPKLLREIGGTDEQLGMSSRYSDRRTDLGNACLNDVAKAVVVHSMRLVTVPLVDFRGLLALAGGRGPDVLVIDIAGVDDELVIAALEAGFQPLILCFSHRHVPEAKMEAVKERFGALYELFEFERYTIAYRNDFLINYCTELFVEHGLPTIFERVMKVVAGTGEKKGV